MPTLIERANELVAQAKREEKCLNLAKNVERKLEDLAKAGKVGNTGLVVSGGLLLAAAVVGFFAPPLGVGMAAGGLAGVANALDSKATALEKATTELKRAVEDLEECLSH